jgi:hypothetical protein
MKKRFFFAIGLGLVFLVVGCKPKREKMPEGVGVGFETFYVRFHEDSVFQMAHIDFPLEGSSAVDTSGSSHPWVKENWLMHRPLNNSQNLFEKRFKVVMPNLLEEYVIFKGQPFASVRRFYKRGDEWFLIYCASNLHTIDEKVENPEDNDPSRPKEIHLDVRPQK